MAPLDRVAVLSDVHCNLTALEAVLADLDACGVHGTYLEGVLDNAEPAPFGIQFVRVPLTSSRRSLVAEASEMPEATAYAIELRTGLYRGYQEASRNV
jgi:hypothetical protein